MRRHLVILVIGWLACQPGCVDDPKPNLPPEVLCGVRALPLTSAMSRTSEGGFETWGIPKDAPGFFDRCVAVAFDASGFSYVAESTNHRIQKLDAEGRPFAIWPLDGRPIAMDASDAGDVAVAIETSTGYELLYLSCTGRTMWRQPAEVRPLDVAIGPQGTVAILSTRAAPGSGIIPPNAKTYTSVGELIAEWQTPHYTSAIAIAADGNVHVIGGVFGGWWNVYSPTGHELHALRTSERLDDAHLALDSNGLAYAVTWNKLVVLDPDEPLGAPRTIAIPALSDGIPSGEVGGSLRDIDLLGEDVLLALYPREVFRGMLAGDLVQETWRRGSRSTLDSYFFPADVATSADGRVAITEYFNRRTQIRGTAGDLRSVVERMSTPLAFDGLGRLLFATPGGVRTGSGSSSLFIPAPVPPPDLGSPAGTISPHGLATWGDEIFLAFAGTHISRVSPTRGNALVDVSEHGSVSTLAMSPGGELWAVQDGQLARYNRDVVFQSAVTPGVGGPIHDLAFDPDGNPYVVAGGGIYELGSDGSLLRTISIPPLVFGGADHANIAITPNGELFVTDERREVVYKVAL